MAIKSQKQIVEFLDKTGHLRFPFGEPQSLSKPPEQLKLSAPEVVKAVASYQDFLMEPLEAKALEIHGRPARHDGDVGPATRAIFNLLRCEHPDYGPQIGMAQGTGGWKGCHNVGNFHAATVYVNPSGMGNHLKPVFEQVWNNTVASYAELGLKLIRVQSASGANMTCSFVGSSSGWIGLALIGPGSCNNQIWQRYLATYRPSNVLREWTTLFKHECGHNVGLQHSRGGVMNPSILQGLPTSWKGDPHWPTLAKMYGGEPVPGGDVGKEYWTQQGFKSNRGRELWVPLNPPILIGE